jgi:hypothetical protein
MLQGAQATRAQLIGIGPQFQRLAQVLWRFKVQLPEERIRARPPRTATVSGCSAQLAGAALALS